MWNIKLLGSRPKAIRMMLPVRALTRKPGFAEQLFVTAQHQQMLDQILDLVGLTLNYDQGLVDPETSLLNLKLRFTLLLNPESRRRFLIVPIISLTDASSS